MVPHELFNAEGSERGMPVDVHVSLTAGYLSLRPPRFDRIPLKKGHSSLLQFLKDHKYLSSIEMDCIFGYILLQYWCREGMLRVDPYSIARLRRACSYIWSYKDEAFEVPEVLIEVFE